MSQVIRYTVKPEFAAGNERLIRDVFDELTHARPPGFSYQSFVQDDGVGFVHVVDDATGADSSPLLALPAFERFQRGIDERCAVAPSRTGMREIGSYGRPVTADSREQVEV